MSNLIVGSAKSGTIAFAVLKLLDILPKLIFKPIAYMLHVALDPFLPLSLRMKPYTLADEDIPLVKFCRTRPATEEEAINKLLPGMRARAGYDSMSAQQQKESDETSLLVIKAMYSATGKVIKEVDKYKQFNITAPVVPTKKSAGELLADMRKNK